MGLFGSEKSVRVEFRRPRCMRLVTSVVCAQEELTQCWRPGHRKAERDKKRYGHGDRESAEKSPRYARNGDERKKDNDRRDRRTDKRHRELMKGACNRLEAALAGIAMDRDVFEYDDRVVNDQADRGCKTAECH